MKPTPTVACISLISAWQAVSLRSALTALLLAPLAALHAAELHVDPTGNDTNAGTKAQPLRTLQAAADRIGWQFRFQSVWKTRLKQELQTKTTNASLKAVHQRNTQARQLAKVEVGREREDGPPPAVRILGLAAPRVPMALLFRPSV